MQLALNMSMHCLARLISLAVMHAAVTGREGSMCGMYHAHSQALRPQRRFVNVQGKERAERKGEGVAAG